jgi:iron(III) transport system substrate-binding protein
MAGRFSVARFSVARFSVARFSVARFSVARFSVATFLVGRGARSAALGAVSIVAVVLAGCSSGGPAAPSPSNANPSSATPQSLAGQTLTLYSGQHPQTVDALVKEFQTRTGVKVSVRSGDEAELANQLIQEGAVSPADVFFAENPPSLTVLEEKGLLAPVDPKALSAVPASDSSPKGDWVGVSARAVLFAANNDQVPAANLPSSVRDLASPAWKGKLGIAPSETDFAPVVTRMIKADGPDATKTWLEGLKANGKVYDSNEDLVVAINHGEVAGGVLDHYYWYRMRDEQGAANMHSALHPFAKGDPGAFLDTSGAAVLNGSKNKDAAQAFVAYLTSAPAQTIIATSESYEYPLAPGVQSTKGLPPQDSIGAIASPADLGDGSQALELLQATGLL